MIVHGGLEKMYIILSCFTIPLKTYYKQDQEVLSWARGGQEIASKSAAHFWSTENILRSNNELSREDESCI